MSLTTEHTCERVPHLKSVLMDKNYIADDKLINLLQNVPRQKVAFHCWELTRSVWHCSVCQHVYLWV